MSLFLLLLFSKAGVVVFLLFHGRISMSLLNLNGISWFVSFLLQVFWSRGSQSSMSEASDFYLDFAFFCSSLHFEIGGFELRVFKIRFNISHRLMRVFFYPLNYGVVIFFFFPDCFVLIVKYVLCLSFHFLCSRFKSGRLVFFKVMS